MTFLHKQIFTSTFSFKSLFFFTVRNYINRRRHSCVVTFELTKKVLASGSRKHTCIGHANHVNDKLHLFSFIGTRKQGEACEELDQDTAEAPHVNLLRIWEDSKHDIRCSVESALDVGVNNFTFKAATSEICDDDSTFVFLFH